jgi:predicted secreted protein
MLALLALVATLHLAAKDNHKSFSVKPKTVIFLTLSSNASTGYSWEPLMGPADTGVLRLVSRKYVAPKNASPGASGKEVFRFRAVRKARAHLRLVYVRRWQQHKPARNFNATIYVR